MNNIESVYDLFDKEIDYLYETKKLVSDIYIKVIDLIYSCKGKVVLSGIGKSGNIATKISSTLSSLGTPSFFIHPTEALHGGLGAIENKDICIILSNSGNTVEIIKLINHLKKIGCDFIGITSNPNSTLALKSKYCIYIPQTIGNSLYNVAPTISTTAMLVVGDVISISIAYLKNYTINDFKSNHPEGIIRQTQTESVS